MPFVRASNKLIYFSHVPKCAGTAVEAYLNARFPGRPMAMRDTKYLSRPFPERWSRSSPQHIPLDELRRLIPWRLFDAMFATVRHPVDRIVSAYLFQKEIEGSVAPGASLEDWLERIPALRRDAPFAYDNHIRPACDFVTDAVPMRVFRLEDGLAPLVAWLDGLAGDADGPREVAPALVRGRRPADAGQVRPPFRAGPRARALIAELYAADYERFGYGPDDRTRY